MVKIIKTNYGIASRCGDVVRVNRRLDKYPKLKKVIIDHELYHSTKYNFEDLTMEFSISQLKGLRWNYYNFILTHPSCWTEYSPVSFEDKEIKVSLSILIFWLFAIGFFWLLFTLL